MRRAAPAPGSGRSRRPSRRCGSGTPHRPGSMARRTTTRPRPPSDSTTGSKATATGSGLSQVVSPQPAHSRGHAASGRYFVPQYEQNEFRMEHDHIRPAAARRPNARRRRAPGPSPGPTPEESRYEHRVRCFSSTEDEAELLAPIEPDPTFRSEPGRPRSSGASTRISARSALEGRRPSVRRSPSRPKKAPDRKTVPDIGPRHDLAFVMRASPRPSHGGRRARPSL